MIDEMITKLIEQANEEATHKGWCDTEMAKNTHTREAKTDEINTLTAKADKLTAAITRLAQEIADLQTAINEIDAAVAKAISVRTAETKKTKEPEIDAPKTFEGSYTGMGDSTGGVVGLLEVI